MDDLNQSNQNDVNLNTDNATSPDSTESVETNEEVTQNSEAEIVEDNSSEGTVDPTPYKKDEFNEIISHRINEVNQKWEDKYQRLEQEFNSKLPSPQLSPDEQQKVEAANTFREIAKYAGFQTPEEVAQAKALQKSSDTYMSQVKEVNDKYVSHGLPKVDPIELADWAGKAGFNPDIYNLPGDFVERIYRDRYFQQVASYYIKNQNKPAPVAKGGAASPSRTLSEADMWNMPIEDLDKYIQG